MKHPRKCMVCGKIYDYCPHCSEYKGLPTWMMGFDSLNCRNIYNAAAQARTGSISKDEARERLYACDLSELDTFEPHIQEWVNDVLGKKTEVEVQSEPENPEIKAEVVDVKDIQPASFPQEEVKEQTKEDIKTAPAQMNNQMNRVMHYNKKKRH